VTRTYYDLLGVSSDASAERVERAYRERLKETHPDVSDAADAGERTQRLIEAREVLTDTSERARYDRLGHEAYVGREDTDTGWADRAAGEPSAGRSAAGQSRAGVDAEDPRSAAADGARPGDGGVGRRSRDAGTRGRDQDGSDGEGGRGAGDRRRR